MGCSFAINSDYLKDFNSFYFVKQRAFCTEFMGEFYSFTAQLELALGKEKKKEDMLCLSIF